MYVWDNHSTATRVRIAIALATMVISLVSKAEDTRTASDLARQYVAARSAMFKNTATATNGGAVSLDPRNLPDIVTSILQHLRTASDWNPSNPEWRRMAKIVEQDLAKLREDAAVGSHPAEIAKQIEGVFVRGFAARLSTDQLRALVHYYSVTPGKNFAEVQAKMLDAVDEGIVEIQRQAAAGQRIVPKQPPPDANEFRQLATLLDERLKIQLAALDPGPKGDRSGLQALPMVMAMGLEASFKRIDALWTALPEQTRTAILDWRESPLGKAERNAIFESAKDIRTVVDIPGETRKITARLVQYEQRWRSEVRQ